MRGGFIVVGAAILFGMASPAAAQQPGIPAPAAMPGDGATVVARINGEAITMDRLKRALATYNRDLGQLAPEAYYVTVLDRVIDQELASRAALQLGLEQQPEIQARLAEARANVLAGAFLGKVAADASDEVTLRRRYEAMAQAGISQVSARHILVKTEAEAAALIVELQRGADFATLAQQHSVGPSGKSGGDLGFFMHKQMVKPFADAAFALAKGAFTDKPVETRFGWHVIKVEDTRAGPPPAYYEVRDELEEQLRTEAMISALQGLRQNAVVERFGPNGAPLPNTDCDR